VTFLPRVGVVGAGQLARMMAEEADDAGVSLVLLASNRDDCAVPLVDDVHLGQATSLDALRELAAHCDVITFDHELVSLPALQALEAEGVTVRPSSFTLAHSVNKAVARDAFASWGLPVPRFLVLDAENPSAVDEFLDLVGDTPVVKAATGGYDGRGVLFPDSRDETHQMVRDLLTNGTVVLEERVTLLAEVAQMVVRGVTGDLVTYPLVTTIQADGMCNEVQFPCALDEAIHAQAEHLTTAIAQAIDLVGVMAVEYFVTPEGLVINEIALRPHNSGHWTIEGCATSQFVNHLLAVTGQGLGPTTPLADAVVMVNVVGADAPGSVAAAEGIDGATVHDYGKSWRPGRKLGHVTVLGDDVASAKVTAWESARAYGTSTKETL